MNDKNNSTLNEQTEKEELLDHKNHESESIDLTKEKERNLKHFSKRGKLILACVGILSVVIISVLIYAGTDNLRSYRKAKKMMDNHQYHEALQILDDLGDYQDSYEQICECRYQMGLSFIEEKEYDDALEIFTELIDKDYKDSSDKKNLCEYEITKQIFDNGDYLLASEYFHSLAERNYKDSEELYKKSLYEMGKKYIEEKSYADAMGCLEGLNYEDSEELLNSIQNGDYSLNKFIKRYNKMAELVRKKQKVSIKNLNINDVIDNEIKTSTGATISFNKSSDEKLDCRYEIESFMWYKKGWVFVDSNNLIADVWCTIAAYDPNNAYEVVGNILSDLIDSTDDGMYGSITYADSYYNTSKTKAELTFSGSPD